MFEYSIGVPTGVCALLICLTEFVRRYGSKYCGVHYHRVSGGARSANERVKLKFTAASRMLTLQHQATMMSMQREQRAKRGSFAVKHGSFEVRRAGTFRRPGGSPSRSAGGTAGGTASGTASGDGDDDVLHAAAAGDEHHPCISDLGSSAQDLIPIKGANLTYDSFSA